MKIKEKYPEANLFYIMPPNIKELEIRLGSRNKKRIDLANSEVKIAKQFDWLIINDDLKKAVDKIEMILNSIRYNKMSCMQNQIFLENFY